MQYALLIDEDESLYGPGKRGPAVEQIVANHMAFNRELGSKRVGGELDDRFWAGCRRSPVRSFRPFASIDVRPLKGHPFCGQALCRIGSV